MAFGRLGMSTLRRRHQSNGFGRHFRTPSLFMYPFAFILVVGVALIFMNIYELHKLREDDRMNDNLRPTVKEIHYDKIVGPIVWVDGINQHKGYLQHVYSVFKQTGFTVGDSSDHWTVLWSHQYPFHTLRKQLFHLEPYQKVNHFPGIAFITNKITLATSRLTFIPKTFTLPMEKDRFRSYSLNHADTLWVQKNMHHRGIEIKTVSELDLTKEKSFIQEYVEKPFLIDGLKFDIGIYTILTSINPLRVYIIDDDALFRFCLQEYYPFDPKVKDKYVVEGDYIPLWNVSSLRDLYSEKGFNFKITFNQYLKSKGLDYKKVWADMISAIRKVCQVKEPQIVAAVPSKHSSTHFFEMSTGMLGRNCRDNLGQFLPSIPVLISLR